MGDENQEGVVALDDLDQALEDLAKSVDATGVQTNLKRILDTSAASNSEEDAKGGEDLSKAGDGNVGTEKDAGPITNLMIGKMVRGMVDGGASQAAAVDAVSNFVAFMSKDDSEEEEEEEDDNGDMDKSLSKSFWEDPAIQEGVEASSFMEAITQRNVDVLTTLEKSISKSASNQTNVNKHLGKAIIEQGKMIKSLAQRLGVVESTPLPAKGKTNVQALSKAIPGEAGGQSEPEPMVKARTAARVLSYLRFQKGMESFCGQPTGTLAIQAEAGSVLPQNVSGAIQQWMKENPSEAEAAKTYQ